MDTSGEHISPVKQAVGRMRWVGILRKIIGLVGSVGSLELVIPIYYESVPYLMADLVFFVVSANFLANLSSMSSW